MVILMCVFDSFFSPRLPTFGLRNSSANKSGSNSKSPPDRPYGSDWGSGISTNTYDQHNIHSVYSSNAGEQQHPTDTPKFKSYNQPQLNSGIALNIIQYHKDNFVRNEERMIGNIPRRNDSQSSHIELIG